MRGGRTLMRSVIAGSLRFRFLVVAAALGIMVFGIAQVPNMRVDVFPEFAPPRVVIQTGCLGLSTSDVEQLVTVPLEQALNGIQGLDTMRSKSVPQLSYIELLFTPDTDVLRARQDVQERLATVVPNLPTWAGLPQMLAPVSATGRAMQIGMTSDNHSIIEMSMMAYWTIRARLLLVPGVANVAIWNERFQQLSVEVQPATMATRQVALNDVMTTTSDAVDSGLLKFSSGSVIGTGGAVQSPTQRIGVRNTLGIVTPADLAKVPVPTAQPGCYATLGDVATVNWDNQPLIGSAVIDGNPGLLFVVEKLPWANTLEMTKGVEKVIRSLKPGMPGVTFNTRIFRQADFIQMAIDNLSQSLALGFLLVMVILGLFLFEWRVALISIVTIPLSLVATMLVLYLCGATINTMTLAGLVIALGAVVDDAIIDVENIVRRLRQHRLAGSDRSTASMILDASLEVRSPIVYATLIIVAAAIPVFMLQGLTGAFFRPLAMSYILAILASMAVALTVTPALALILLAKAPIEQHDSPVVSWLQRGYQAALSRIVVHPSQAYAAAAVLLLAGIVVAPQLGQSLFPAFKERDLLMHWVSAPGTSVADMERTTRRSTAAAGDPGRAQFRVAHRPGPARRGDRRGQPRRELGQRRPERRLHRDGRQGPGGRRNHPGFYRDVQTYLDERIEEVLTGGKAPIIMRVFGDDQTVMKAKANEIEKLLRGIHGVVDPHVDLVGLVPQLEIDRGPRQGPGQGPQTRRRPPGSRGPGRQRGGRQRLHQGQDLQRRRLEHPGHPQRPDSPGQPAHRHALRRPRPARRRRRHQHQTHPERHRPRERLPQDRRQRRRQRRGPRTVAAGINEQLAQRGIPAGLPRRSHRRVPGAAGRPEPHVHRRHRRRGGHLPAAAAVLRQLAARRLVFLTLPFALVGGVLAVWTARASSRSARSSASSPSSASPPATASCSSATTAIWKKSKANPSAPARPPRRRGTPHPDPHDRPGHRPRPRPARHQRQPARPRNRIPHGRRHPRRPHHLDPAQPVRRPLAPAAVRTPKPRPHPAPPTPQDAPNPQDTAASAASAAATQ